MPCASLASLWRVERLTLRAAGPGVASSWCNWHCATWCMHQLHQTFRHDTCAEILTCLSRVAFAIGVTRSSSLSSLPLAPPTSKPHALPLILPLTPMHTDISASAKKNADEAKQQHSSYEETVLDPSAAEWQQSGRRQDGRCRLFQRHFLRQPSWQQTTSSLALGQISECQFPLLIWQAIEGKEWSH